MALVNGHTEARETPHPPSQHLGKRKRTPSPERDISPIDGKLTVQDGLTDAIRIIKRHDSSGVILKFPLSGRSADGHTIKRQRTETPDVGYDNIESRVSSNAYETLSELLEDINEVKSAVLDKNVAKDGIWSQGIDMGDCVRIINETLSDIQTQVVDNELSAPSRKTNGDGAKNSSSPKPPSSQVLSLRSQTEHGIRQLFSGLPSDKASIDIDARRLPNGFELTEVISVDKNDFYNKDMRRFGEVFSPHRNTKTLEMPKAARSSRGNTLDFVAPFENLPASGKNDFKLASLSTGLWIKYATTKKSGPISKDRAQDATKSGALFKAAFSTFAPNTDNSDSIITDFDKSRHWWNKVGRPARTIHKFAVGSDTDNDQESTKIDKTSDQELEEMITNFISEDEIAAESDFESENILEDISELLETLSSYQTLRHLQIAKGPSSASKPSDDEQNTYEILRSQLQVLVSTLPPFAVAKLNGQQLNDLNISTQILFHAPEFVGTSQVDDYTLRRNRATQAATSAAIRAVPPVPNRTAYGTPASAYNAQARAYNNIPNSAYATRPTTGGMYNTPRPSGNPPPGTYTPSQYRPSPTIHTPSVQQFQRPTVNGYGSTTSQVSQSSYMQRPSQPGYQQRAQDTIAYNRSELSQKPMMNGEGSQFQQRQFSTPSQNAVSNLQNLAGQQRGISDSIKHAPSLSTPRLQGNTAEAIKS